MSLLFWDCRLLQSDLEDLRMDESLMYVKIAAYVAAAFTIGVGTLGPTFGQGKIGSTACENIGKYPEMSNKIQTAMFAGLAMVETSALFAFLIAILLVLGS